MTFQVVTVRRARRDPSDKSKDVSEFPCAKIVVDILKSENSQLADNVAQDNSEERAVTTAQYIRLNRLLANRITAS